MKHTSTPVRQHLLWILWPLLLTLSCWFPVLAADTPATASSAQATEPNASQPTPQQAEPDAGEAPADDPSAADSPSDNGLPMDLQRLHELLLRIDPELQRDNNAWQFRLRERILIAVADANADRMRIMSPVIEAAELDDTLMLRLLQANFDSALDARYAVANDVLWSVFIHPLSPLDEQQLSSGIFQTFTAATTFGTLFSSGMFIYGGGDSNEELEKLQQELDELLSPSI